MESNVVDILTQSPAPDNVLIFAKASDLQDFAKEFAALLLKQAAITQEKEKAKITRKPIPAREACKVLNITYPTLVKYRRKNYFKGHVLEGKVYYFEDELLAAFRDRK
jgi:hypothetical protein